MNATFRDYGWEMDLAAQRLAEFNSVTNAYLSIFMVLGALGLLVGTFGLVVVLWRSVLERSREIALLKAVGYGRKEIRRLVVREYMFLLLMGIGTMGAFLGPPLAGWAFDTYGSYQNVWFVVAGFAFASMLFIWTMPGQVKAENDISG